MDDVVPCTFRFFSQNSRKPKHVRHAFPCVPFVNSLTERHERQKHFEETNGECCE